MKKAVFFDRDGTLIRDSGYLADPRSVCLFEDTREALAMLRSRYLFFLFSNQSGIGRGYYKLADALAVNRRMEELLAFPERLFTDVCLPAEPPGEPSAYRKPSPRFIVETRQKYKLPAAGCWMVGDRLTDLQAGVRAGIPAALVRVPPEDYPPDFASYVERHQIPAFPTLRDFACYLLEQEKSLDV